jgi:uncharacterized protein (DUF885 family)
MTDATAASTEATASERAVDARSERFVFDIVALDPETATYLGIGEYDDRVSDLTPDGFAAREEVIRQARADVEALQPVDAREQAARDAFLERLGVQLDRYAAKNPQAEISVVSSAAHHLRQVFDLMSTDGEEAWANIGARLDAVPGALADYQRTLLTCADEGVISAKRQFREVAAQIRGWTGRTDSGANVFTELADQAQGPETLRRQVTTAAERASVAFAAFGEFLEQDLLPRGRDKDAVGREQYARDSRYFLGATIDLDETYAWGWQELKRIEDDMAVVAGQILRRGRADGAGTPGADSGSVDEAVAKLDADPTYKIEGKENFRAWMQGLADRTVSEMADVHFDIPEPVRTIECCLAPTHDGGIYYTGPSEDFSRPGRMWWAVPDGITDFSTWREVTTVYHEGVPGHHLQVAQTQFRKELLNRWQRQMCWVSGHGEGWALYSERLMDDLGYLADPADKLGMLDAQGFRAARVIVDIGMHLELEIPPDNPFGFHPGERWTPELGLEFMRQHCRMEDAFIRFEVNRYLGWPGQAPSYKVGERIWLQARDEARARQGADFDLKGFHRAALDLGSLGLDPMRQALARL